MHVLVLLAVIALIAVLAMNLRPRRDAAAGFGTPSQALGAGKAWTQPLAFISRGKLFYQAPGQPLKEIQSPYVQGVMDRMERSKALHGWKEGTAFGTAFSRQDTRGQTAQLQIHAKSAQFIAGDRILYFLKDDRFGGLFEQNLADGSEKRLVHKQNLSLEDLRVSADGSRLLCAQHAANGTANIAVMNADGSGAREITGGDTADTAPAWIPDKPNQFLFQSAGLARDPRGFVIAHGPVSIQLADMEQDALTAVREDPQFDFLQPRVGADGALYFIRRPYEMPRYDVSSALLDVVLFPFRLLRALFHYLNFFSLMYTRKPLTTASGPALNADLKEILLKGKRVDAEAALRKGALVNGVPSLVPASWQLVRRSQGGEEKVLATHVSAFDLSSEGTVLFSNGNGVFAIDGGASPNVLLRDHLIEDVIARPEHAATAAASVREPGSAGA